MKILLVTCRYPWPARRGDQMRAVQFLEALSVRHELHLLTPPPDGATQVGAAPGAESMTETSGVEVEIYDPGRPALQAVRGALAGQPVQAGLFQSPDLERRVARHSRSVDVVVLQLARLGGLLSVCEAPTYVDLIDALSLNFRSRSRLDRVWLRPFLREEARRLEAMEARILAEAAGSCVVCSRDREFLSSLDGVRTDSVDVIRLPMTVNRSAEAADSQRAGSSTIALTGNLGYFVNHDAVRWWLREIWPAVRSSLPNARLVIAGDRTPRSLRTAVISAGAELIASPERLLDVVEAARVCIAPMRCGSGVPVKVLEAWSVGTPVVASRYAAEGAAGRDGEDLLVAGDADEWVASLARCFEEPRMANSLAVRGQEHLVAEHDLATIAEVLRERVEAAATGGRPA